MNVKKESLVEVEVIYYYLYETINNFINEEQETSFNNLVNSQHECQCDYKQKQIRSLTRYVQAQLKTHDYSHVNTS